MSITVAHALSAPQTEQPVSGLTEQTISAHLTVEVMRDADDGTLCLAAATDSNMGDLQEVTTTQALVQIANARATLDRQEALVRAYQLRPVCTEANLRSILMDTLDGLMPEILASPDPRGALRDWTSRMGEGIAAITRGGAA